MLVILWSRNFKSRERITSPSIHALFHNVWGNEWLKMAEMAQSGLLA
jgi:hypothetical protein